MSENLMLQLSFKSGGKKMFVGKLGVYFVSV